MNMGSRLKQELEDRGMRPIDLCSIVPDLDIGTLSALYKRDSRNSKFAPSIAKSLGVELHWLLTGEEPKFKQPVSTAASGDQQFADKVQAEVSSRDIPDQIKQTILILLSSSPEKKK